MALLIVAAGCAGQASTPSPSSAPTPTGALLTVTTRGGLCAAGACESTIFIERDGRVHFAAKPPNDLGVVPPEQLAALASAIDATDFAELRSHPFTGTCPTAWDGQETVFDFGTAGGVEQVASCATAIDWTSPLFVAVADALRPFAVIPGG